MGRPPDSLKSHNGHEFKASISSAQPPALDTSPQTENAEMLKQLTKISLFQAGLMARDIRESFFENHYRIGEEPDVEANRDQLMGYFAQLNARTPVEDTRIRVATKLTRLARHLNKPESGISLEDISVTGDPGQKIPPNALSALLSIIRWAANPENDAIARINANYLPQNAGDDTVLQKKLRQSDRNLSIVRRNIATRAKKEQTPSVP